MLLVLAGCGGGKTDAPASGSGSSGSAWTEVPYNPPILSGRTKENPFNEDADPKNAFAMEVGQLFKRDLENPDPKELVNQVQGHYDGTTTLFLQMPNCNHAQLARHLQVIGAAKAKKAGFTVLSCLESWAGSTKAAIEIP